MRKYLSGKAFAAFAILAIAVWVLYAQTAAFEFLRFDDQDYTHRCPFVFDGFSVGNLIAAFSSFSHAAIWMPLTYISYMLGISAFGPGAGAHHLVNVALHTLNAALLVLLIRRVAGCARRGAAAPPGWLIPCCAAAFWALHPQRVEAVAWIASRKDLLCAVFSLAALLAWRPGRLNRAVAFAAAAGACMSKPSAVSLPFLLFAMEALSLGTLKIWRRSSIRRVALRYLPLLLIALATGAVAIYSQTNPDGFAPRGLFTAPFWWRLLNAVVAAGLDIWHTLVPVGIYLDYRATPGAFPSGGALGIAVFAAVAALLAIAAKRMPTHRAVISFLAIWFVAALLPTLGLFGSFGEHARADRFTYIPAMAFSFAFALIPFRRGLRFLAALPAIAAFGFSWPVVASYRNDYTAFSRTLAFDPEHPRALAHVASEECARHGRLDRGIELFRQSHALRPRDDTAAQLAYALMMRGRAADYAEITRLCAKFVCDHRLDPKGMALEAMGVTELRRRRWREAIALLESSVKAPRRFYSPADARLCLAVAYANSRHTAKAEEILIDLARSSRPDIRSKAEIFLQSIRRSPNAQIFL